MLLSLVLNAKKPSPGPWNLPSVKRSYLLKLIIINDASGAATKGCLDRIESRYGGLFDNRLTIIDSKRQMGPAGARNRGWKTASQELLAFLDADDAWHPEKIEIQYASMVANPDVAITGHDSVWLKPGAATPALKNTWKLKRIRPIHHLISNRFHTRSVMLRRNIPFRFEEGKRCSEDYLLWSEILLNGYKGGHIELPLAYCFKPQYGASGLSGNLWKMEKGELDTYCRLYKKQLISFFHVFGLFPLSLAKYAKRKVLTPRI